MLKKIITVLSLVKPDKIRMYFPVYCKGCNWQGSSENTAGGGQIADTGDYGEPLCPKCGEVVEDAETNYIRVSHLLLYAAKRLIRLFRLSCPRCGGGLVAVGEHRPGVGPTIRRCKDCGREWI